ncbi:hypothetical protein HYH03_011155 [Edaphochlamys debaryana]|uniref:Vacuolar fusion protein MON1 homolog n=1 Tax=Edaphochlamys debaryana TaxID=47281 RepID=A0A835XU90_9CHLO|nr:hypothetical protein HYH03_011155 [Edaphochlamys debaryana]|eukprot:KAG2490353.1 hypothetical protein HYH03_011155 [Edaphochlamys debaryana]
MDTTDEPVIASASVERSSSSGAALRSLGSGGGHGTAAEPAGGGAAAASEEEFGDEEDEEDDADSVGGRGDDNDDADALEPSQPHQPSDERPTVDSATGAEEPEAETSRSRTVGESVEAIEAAVASLALKHESARRLAAAAAASAASAAPSEPSAEAQPAFARASEPDSAAAAGQGGDGAATPRPPALAAAAGIDGSASASASGGGRSGDADGGSAVASTSAPTFGDDSAGTAWEAYPKHFFILSSSGKPIYSLNGDERSLVGLTALLSALVSVVQSTGDAVQHIRSGSTLVVFMLRGPLYFVAASRMGEPATALRRQLELMYGQMVLVVTTGLERIIQRNPSYDVRSLLDGVGSVLGSLAAMLAADATSYLLGAHRPLPMPAADRAAVTELLAEAVRQSGALYGLLMADTHALALCRAKGQPPLAPDDLLLLANFVMCNNAYRHGHGEAFSPVCLPSFNPDAFLHAYIHYLDASAGLYLVLLSGSAEAFHPLSAARVWLEDATTARGLMPRLRALRPPELFLEGTAGPGTSGAAAAAVPGATGGAGAEAGARPVGGREPQPPLNVLSVESLPRPLGGKFGHTPLWSYALRYNGLPVPQALASPPCPLHRSAAGAKRLAAAYAQLHSLLHSPAAPGRPNKLAWFADSSLALCAVRDRDLELYLVLDPLTDKTTGMGLVEAMRRHFLDRQIMADLTLTPAPPA